MASFTLTVGSDTEVGGAADDTVYATAATLNAGDSLTGGAGTDVLVLIGGSSTFRVDQLASFTGFERIRLDNATNYSSYLTLGSQPIEVDAAGPWLVQANSPSNWNASNIVKGDASHTFNTTTVYFYNSQAVYPPLPVTYDLTSNTFSHVNIGVSGDNITLLINNADTAGVQSFTGFGQKLVTAGSTLDLSHTTVNGLSVTSTNALGTAFTISDLGTAFQIAGGAGQDTIIASGFTFSADQRNTIFATASVETIVDQTGTYATGGHVQNVVEANGSTRLTEVGNHFFLYDGGGTGPSLKYAGGDYVAGQIGAWAPIAAEQTASGYEVAWQNGSADQYTVWNIDSSGNFLSSIGAVSGDAFAFESLEPSFHQDLNGDGYWLL